MDRIFHMVGGSREVRKTGSPEEEEMLNTQLTIFNVQVIGGSSQQSCQYLF